jgi:hypothetical protein
VRLHRTGKIDAAATPLGEALARVAELEAQLAAGGGKAARIAELERAQARIEELEREVARLRAATGALPETPEDWAARRLQAEQQEAALREARRKARRAQETPIDEKSREDYERQIKALNTKLRNERRAHNFHVSQLKAQGKAALDKAGYKLILACLHPDNSASEQKRNKAFVLFQGLGIEPREPPESKG